MQDAFWDVVFASVFWNIVAVIMRQKRLPGLQNLSFVHGEVTKQQQQQQLVSLTTPSLIYHHHDFYDNGFESQGRYYDLPTISVRTN
jgi:hypothetical protein